MLGVRIRRIRMPVAPARNIAILVEVAARNQLLRAKGYHAARALANRLEQAIQADEGADVETVHDDLENDDELEPGGGGR
jgi:HPr kinase/phosphorylase